MSHSYTFQDCKQGQSMTINFIQANYSYLLLLEQSWLKSCWRFKVKKYLTRAVRNSNNGTKIDGLLWKQVLDWSNKIKVLGLTQAFCRLQLGYFCSWIWGLWLMILESRWHQNAKFSRMIFGVLMWSRNSISPAHVCVILYNLYNVFVPSTWNARPAEAPCSTPCSSYPHFCFFSLF